MSRPRAGFTLIELLVVIVILVILASLVLIAVQRVRAQAVQLSCSNNLRNLGVALHAFESVHRQLPGKRAALPGRFSYVVEILPQLEQKLLYDQVDFSVDRPTIVDVMPETEEVLIEYKAEPKAAHARHNGLRRTALGFLNCPAEAATLPYGNNYCPLVSAQGARNANNQPLRSWLPPDNEVNFPLPPKRPASFLRELQPLRLDTIPDGLGQSACLAERVKGYLMTKDRNDWNQVYPGGIDASFRVQGSQITLDNAAQVRACETTTATPSLSQDASGSVWFQHTCEWLGCANLMAPPNSRLCSGSNSQANLASTGSAAPSSYHGSGAHLLMFDATAHFFSSQTDLPVLHALGTINGHEVYPFERR